MQAILGFFGMILSGLLAVGLVVSTIAVWIFTALVGIAIFLFKATVLAAIVALGMAWEKFSRK